MPNAIAISDFHAKLYAHELLRHCPTTSVERFTAALLNSQVDLNPHQIDATLFAFRSPLSKGAILADEVGLGKTIEAGIVISQKWAERKRKILLILPSSLRKQWHQELQDKFYLPSQILESRNFNQAAKQGHQNPFDIDEIVICSYDFARNKAKYIQALQWDLVVIDEAHRLRNVYKSSNKIARKLKEILTNAPKLLLTATPLQNSLLELYGLVGFIDEHIFGDIKSFKNQFVRLSSEDNFEDLKQRLKFICKRTLRRQVLEYISYTERKAYTQEFIPSEDEDTLYELVSDYLRKPNLQALPSSQRSLMTLVLRKLLASSTFAIAGALEALSNKLEKRLKEDEEDEKNKSDRVNTELEEDFEIYNELTDEFDIEDEDSLESLILEDRDSIQQEIKELRAFFELAMGITENAKGTALLQALDYGFYMAMDLGGAEKAVIFTESRRTQNYLLQLLSEAGYSDNIVLFNGSNTDLKSRQIYADWKVRYKGTNKITDSQTADTRAALVDYFREKAKIMIATEAAAEGINLQFCSLVINYDLPWNPQRIEQRIGRCHRYGQKHDVVVVNFLNKNNAADQRVYKLLSEKFQLFNGVFGVSDEVLGTIESGVDFEKRIVEIYQTCRTSEEIQQSFDKLQEELSVELNENLRLTRQKLLENFDAEVAEKLNIYKVEATKSLNRYEALLWDTTRHILGKQADFKPEDLIFCLNHSPKADIPTGIYTLNRQNNIGHHYRLHHLLAHWVLEQAKNKSLPKAELIFDYSGYRGNISILEPLVGQSGTLIASRLTIQSIETEDYLILAAITQDGHELDSQQARRLFNLSADVIPLETILTDSVEIALQRHKKEILVGISERNALFFEEEIDKLNRWAEDRRKTLKSSLKDFDDEIATLKKQARAAPNLPEKLNIQKKIRNLDKKRDEAWREYDEAAREVESQKDKLIDDVEGRLEQEIEEENLFSIRWTLI
jgi:ERCC4-related helicase